MEHQTETLDESGYSSSFHSIHPEYLWLPVSPSAASTAVESHESKASGESQAAKAAEDTEAQPEGGLAGRDHEDKGPAAAAPLPSGSATLRRAKALSKIALDESTKGNSRRASQASHVQKLREECQAARTRIQVNVSSVSKAFETARSLEGYLVHIEDSKNRVKHARNARWADLEVCQERLQILSNLDWSEFESASVEGLEHMDRIPRDRGLRRSLAEALEIEQEALLLLRRELGSLLTYHTTVAEVAAELRGKLQQEASQRRAAMRKDHVALTQPGEGQEVQDFKAFDEGNFWVKKARSLEDSAQQLMQKSVSTIQWTDVECAKASHRVQECLSRCSEEDQLLRWRYDAQLKDVDFAISCADWTVNKPGNKSMQGSDPNFSQVQRANVLLHELNASKRHLKSLVRKCKRDLQILEACRNTTPFTIHQKRKERKARKEEKSMEVEKSRHSEMSRRTTSSESSGRLGGLDELRQLQAEERELKRELRACETGVERCAAWASLLADLEDRIAETLRR